MKLRPTLVRVTLTLALAALALPAHALKVATWNLLAYDTANIPLLSQRQAYYRTVFAALDPDVLITQEINTSAAKDSMLNNVLNVVAPGQWSGAWTALGATSGEGGAIFWKPAKVAVSNVSSVATGGPRNMLTSLVKPVGYVKNGAWFRMYSVHLKAGALAADAATRASECASIRNTINNTPQGSVGPNFLIGGDSNFYGADEAGYVALTQSGANNNGQCADPLAFMTGSWHQIPGYGPYDTQCPCSTCNTSGQSGGGLDDRFDWIMSANSLRDATGIELLVPTYGAYGNDGQHYNWDINGGGFNWAVPIAVANALHDASDHIPVSVQVQLPAKYSVPSALAIGDAIVGGAPTATLTVGDAPPQTPADSLRYTLTAGAGFTAPAGSFAVAPGGSLGHAIGMDASTTGVKTGTVTLASNDNDTTSKVVALNGRVLAHAVPSLDSLAVTTAGAIDFGAHPAAEFTDADVRVHDQGYGALQSQLRVTAGAITGDAHFSIVGGFTPVTLGAVGQTWTVHFDASAIAAVESTYTATLTFATADDALPGGVTQSPLTVALTAHVQAATDAVGPGALALRFYPPRPNPLRGGTELAFDLPRAAHVALGVFDLSGRRIATLVDGELGQGHHALRWNAQDDAGRGAAAGLYFVRFMTEGRQQVARLAVLP